MPASQAIPHSGAGLKPILVIGLGLPELAPSEREDEGRPPAWEDRLLQRQSFKHPALYEADVLVGGREQLAMFEDLPAEKLRVGGDFENLFTYIRILRETGKRIVILCSGDPLFFGLGASLLNYFGNDALRFVPGTSTLQAAGAFCGMAWNEVRTVSLHGRDSMLPLAHALMSNAPVLLLTDHRRGPADVAAWMLDRGCSGYGMRILEDLRQSADGEVHAENNEDLTLEQALKWEPRGADRRLQMLLLLIPLGQDGSKRAEAAGSERPGHEDFRLFGLSDSEIASEGGLLTKAPVRAAGLAALGISPEHTVWDLGAGSGAVSVEAARLAYQGRVIAVEKDLKRVELIRENRRRFGAANLEIIQGNMLELFSGPEPLSESTRPHRIFIGGGLGKSRETTRALLEKLWRALLPGGRLLSHCVLLSSLENARAALKDLGAGLNILSIQAGESVPLGDDLRISALNPVFLVLARKPEGHGADQ